MFVGFMKIGPQLLQVMEGFFSWSLSPCFVPCRLVKFRPSTIVSVPVTEHIDFDIICDINKNAKRETCF